MSNENSTAAVAVARMSFALAKRQSDEDRAIQAGIDEAMRQVVGRDARHNPNAIGQLDKVMPAGAVRATDGVSLTPGWAKEIPLEPPIRPGSMAEKVIGAMCDRMLGPAVPPKK